MNIIDKIDNALNRTMAALGGLGGGSFPIPPNTAELIRKRRKSLLNLDDLQIKYGMSHTGWAEFVAPANLVGVVDPVTLHMMHLELAEMSHSLGLSHKIPISLIAGLEYAVAHEPAKFMVFIKGKFALIHESKGTPSLYRIAHEGAELGYWDAEELLLLPPPLLAMPMEMMGSIDFTSNQSDYDMEMA
tara:strand:+ start:5399 stop:5962 length:564 start_codon:yes stop_codon:yes gene_type:complete